MPASCCSTRPWWRSPRGELSPIVTGLIYCSVIEGCQQVYELRRAREWTAALTRWCEEQPDMVNFTGRCLVHRAEILQLRGAWPAALDEARRAGRALRAGDARGRRPARPPTGRGRSTACGASSPLPRRRTARPAGAAGSRSRGWRCCAWPRVTRTPPPPRSAESWPRPPALERAGLLPAYVEIMLAAGRCRRRPQRLPRARRDRRGPPKRHAGRHGRAGPGRRRAG